MEQLSCSPRRDEFVLCKRRKIELGPGQQILLLVVMRHDGNRFLFGHRHGFVFHAHILLTHFHSLCSTLEGVWQTIVTGEFRDQKPFSIKDLALPFPTRTSEECVPLTGTFQISTVDLTAGGSNLEV